jgi:hypothetical protein
MSNDLLMNAQGSRIVRYFGNDSQIAIPDQVEILGNQAFAHRKSLRLVQFGPNSRLATIEGEALVGCLQLESIVIPGTLTFLDEGVFYNCNALRQISFEAGASPKTLGESLLRGCKVLETFVVPASVEVIEASCFCVCERLESVVFTPDSKLVKIMERAFSHCLALKSLDVPASVEVIGLACFFACGALAKLTFVSPAHIRELLDLPLALTEVPRIPDSVENLVIPPLRGPARRAAAPAMAFGADSNLKEFKGDRAFLHLAKRSLMAKRSDCEYQGTLRTKRWFSPFDTD